MIITQTEFLEQTSLDAATLDIWLQEEWLLPDGGPNTLLFSDMDVARARLIGSLMQDLGVNAEGVGIALHLMDQVYSLRNLLRANQREALL